MNINALALVMAIEELDRHIEAMKGHMPLAANQDRAKLIRHLIQITNETT